MRFVIGLFATACIFSVGHAAAQSSGALTRRALIRETRAHAQCFTTFAHSPAGTAPPRPRQIVRNTDFTGARLSSTGGYSGPQLPPDGRSWRLGVCLNDTVTDWARLDNERAEANAQCLAAAATELEAEAPPTALRHPLTRGEFFAQACQAQARETLSWDMRGVVPYEAAEPLPGIQVTPLEIDSRRLNVGEHRVLDAVRAQASALVACRPASGMRAYRVFVEMHPSGTHAHVFDLGHPDATTQCLEAAIAAMTPATPLTPQPHGNIIAERSDPLRAILVVVVAAIGRR